MKKWTVYGIMTASYEVGTVEAETQEEAEEKADELRAHTPIICHHCSRKVQLGDVYELQVEESDD